MNSKYILMLFSIYIMCICSSCSDFLKEVSQDEFEPKTASAFQELLNGEGYSTTTCFDPITDILTDDVEELRDKLIITQMETWLIVQSIRGNLICICCWLIMI